MSLSIQKVVKSTGLTSRTLRHWETLGLLRAVRADNGVRTYDSDDLTQIFYIKSLRQLELPLGEIHAILSAQKDDKTAIEQHVVRLSAEQKRLEQLIERLREKLQKGDFKMSEKDFDALKTAQLQENEAAYGDELRTKYGNEMMDASDEKFKAQTEEESGWAHDTHEKIVRMLEIAFLSADEKLADEAVSLHKQWLEHYWPQPVTPAAHCALGQMYVDDTRFRKAYDRAHDGVAAFFAAAIARHYGTDTEK
ncbi:MAG: TipAS antibiotic-recognition domain-containing protein [Streptococcaceae bacterium]|jgi:DNA-binding transcriptional MerR regulator|nr:TipAS antibiotic-recognition domain-containing protein [Streptococcaceae bacterium]